MEPPLVSDMKRYVAFSDADAATLRALGPALEPVFDHVIERFYQRLREDPVAAAILERSGIGDARFRRTLRGWVEGLFDGCYDAAHFERVSRIGHSHVRVLLPQWYMITATNVVRNELTETILRLDRPDPTAAVLALNKILDLDAATMLDSYREDYVRQLRGAERQRMERHLQEVSHLANVGELAASLAHEIKNPLAGISGAIQVIGSALEPDDPRREIISEILSQIDRLDRTVRDLLIYARPKPPSRTPKDLAKLIQRALKFLRQEPSMGDIPIRLQGFDVDASARVDEAQIEQVINNLILNAAQACKRGGEITIRLSADPDYVHVLIADDGAGMTRETLERAFEPFFTTKSRGTGLGLAICKRIVEVHHGQITLASAEGKGTQVRVQLPR